jgi:hypothetical protein
MTYWVECITEAFEDCGLVATQEQLDCVVAWAEGAHENYSMATGRDNIPNPMQVELDNANFHHSRDLEEKDRQLMVYRNSVARRRGVDVGNVYIDRDDVVYSNG